ncbi:MAG: hypothetical protein ACRC6I_19725 [Paracoccaceae bacterium]
MNGHDLANDSAGNTAQKTSGGGMKMLGYILGLTAILAVLFTALLVYTSNGAAKRFAERLAELERRGPIVTASHQADATGLEDDVDPIETVCRGQTTSWCGWNGFSYGAADLPRVFHPSATGAAS